MAMYHRAVSLSGGGGGLILPRNNSQPRRRRYWQTIELVEEKPQHETFSLLVLLPG